VITATAEAPQAHTRPDAEALLRVVLFRPYRRGMGPAFVLTMWATYRTDNRRQTVIGYRLTQVCPRALVSYETLSFSQSSHVLFEAEDFSGSPMNADDSDETVEDLMGFLTLRPGDTDEEYFENYTEAQREYCDAHAESLSWEVMCRFDKTAEGYGSAVER